METYLVLPSGIHPALSSSLQHYNPHYHKFEERASFTRNETHEPHHHHDSHNSRSSHSADNHPNYSKNLEISQLFEVSRYEEGKLIVCPEIVPNGSFLVGVTTIHWRETWKCMLESPFLLLTNFSDGERGLRYTLLDLGHVIINIRLSAAAHGWTTYLLCANDDEYTRQILGLKTLRFSKT